MAHRAPIRIRLPARRRRKAVPRWTRLSDEELLDLRFCDLGLRIEGTAVAPQIKRLYAELDAAGLKVRPHCWLAEEWFSPDGVPGIAIPFYLSHPRLDAARAAHDARSGGRQFQLDDANPASRSGSRGRLGVPPATPAALARSLWTSLAALSGQLSPAAWQPALRATSRFVVRAEPSDGGLRRDFRGVAETTVRLAPLLRWLACTGKTRSMSMASCRSSHIARRRFATAT